MQIKKYLQLIFEKYRKGKIPGILIFALASIVSVFVIKSIESDVLAVPIVAILHVSSPLFFAIVDVEKKSNKRKEIYLRLGVFGAVLLCQVLLTAYLLIDYESCTNHWSSRC